MRPTPSPRVPRRNCPEFVPVLWANSCLSVPLGATASGLRIHVPPRQLSKSWIFGYRVSDFNSHHLHPFRNGKQNAGSSQGRRFFASGFRPPRRFFPEFSGPWPGRPLPWFRSAPSMTGLRILCNTRFVVLVSLPGFHRISFPKLTTDQTDRRGTITAFIRVDP